MTATLELPLEPAEVAAVAAEALRSVNHLTLATPSPGTQGWEDIGDLYRVLAEMGILVGRVPQALDQIARHLERLASCVPGFDADPGTQQGAEELVAVACSALGDAEEHANEAAHRLGGAQNAVAHLRPTLVLDSVAAANRECD